MQRKHMVAAAIIAIAVLLPTGQWVVASRRQTATRNEDMKVEQQFIASRQGAGQPMAAGPGKWGGKPNGAPSNGEQAGDGARRRGGGRRGQGGGQRRMAQMVKEVGLTPTQVKQLQAVQASSRPMMSDLFRNPQLTREQKMAAMQQIRQSQQEQIAKFLTPDQQTKYTAFQEQMRQQRQTRRGNGGFGRPAGP